MHRSSTDGLSMNCISSIRRVSRILSGVIVLNAFLAPFSFAAPTQTPPSLELTVAGSAATVFDWSSMRCEDWDVPDVPVRAWRGADQQIHLVASHFRNRIMTGATLKNLKHPCPVIFEGEGQDAPALSDDRSWIAATYSIDGETVYALVHNEFQGNHRPALCPSARYMSCWRNSITLAISRDDGRTFTHAPPPDHYVAGVPYRYEGDAGHPTGLFAPSNIIAKDGFYYAFLWAEETGVQRRGVCLMRTSDLEDRKSWRAWDGSSFSVAFVDPYAADIGAPSSHVCAPVGEGRMGGFIASVTKHRPTGAYVALMATTRPSPTGGKPISGIFFATSTDLINWSTPTLLLDLPMQFDFTCSDEAAYFYPSLLDPDSPSRNFEDTGDHADLYLTKIYLDKCKLGMKRDLVRIPVTIDVRH
jgi:hypothetical protein